MMPKPYFKSNQKVRFTFSKDNSRLNERIGIIKVVNAYGTFANSEIASYDIFVESDGMIYKRVPQSMVREYKD